jgi:hypothetical protein
MRRWSLGTYHSLRRKHVDTYLNEFVFRYNRRYYRHVSFETLLGLAADKEPASYWDIIKRDNPRKSASRTGSAPLLHIDQRDKRLHSDGKIELFYKSMMLLLFLTFVVRAAIGGITFAREPHGLPY